MTDQEKKDAAIKAQYGDVSKLEIFVSETDTVIGYVKKINRATLSAAMAKFDSDPLMACEIILTNCLIKEESDRRILDDEEIFISAAPAVQNIIKLKKSTLTKL